LSSFPLSSFVVVLVDLLFVLVVVLVLVVGSLPSNILHEHPLFEDDDEYDDESM